MSVSQVNVSLSAEQAQVLVLLLPHLAPVRVERVQAGAGLVRAWVRPRADGAVCPGCGTWRPEVHSRYTRTLADTGIGGRRVLIHLVVRLLRCGGPGCKATFAEQPEGLASRYARRTPPLQEQLAAVAAALAGRAGARLAGVLGAEASRHTMIRVLMALPVPAAGAVRVLGVDDFSLRRGQSYATLLVDMETGDPVDVLPDREAATLEAWLKAHPGTEVICRDRGGAYADGARKGAPDAIQVADQWHLYHNLCEHARDAVARHRDCISGTGTCQAQDQDPLDQDPLDQDGEAADLRDLEEVIRERHAAVHALRAGGKTIAQAARELRLTRQLVKRYWRAGAPGGLLAARGTSALDPYKPYLRRRWDQGTATIKDLHREITGLGYPGSYSTTYAWLGLLKLAAPPRPPAPPTPRQLTSMLTADPARLTAAQHATLAQIRARCPCTDALARHVTGFAKILRRRDPSQLDSWITAVGADPAQHDLHSFTNGIRQDYDAVRAALALHWNSGRVEGLNTRTKLIKRQMYGRATFPVLRQRILLRTITSL